ncbi:MAG: DUF6710 family protein [Oscillospiraceae bacterium]
MCLFKQRAAKFYSQNAFTETLNLIENKLETETSLNCKIDILDYMFSIVKNDLQYSLLTDVFYKFPKEPIHIIELLPEMLCDENNVLINFIKEQPKREIDFQSDCVLAVPWNISRIFGSIKTINDVGFEYIKTNQKCIYFPIMDLTFVKSSNHHIAAALAVKKGITYADTYDIETAFSYITTDGTYWYNSRLNKKIEKVNDFRIAILFQLSKIKFEITKQAANFQKKMFEKFNLFAQNYKGNDSANIKRCINFIIEKTVKFSITKFSVSLAPEYIFDFYNIFTKICKGVDENLSYEKINDTFDYKNETITLVLAINYTGDLHVNERQP